MRVSGIEWADVGGPPKQYRIYFFDGAGQIAVAPYEFEAPDDETAMRIAEAWREGRTIELWNRERKVRCWGFASCANPLC